MVERRSSGDGESGRARSAELIWRWVNRSWSLKSLDILRSASIRVWDIAMGEAPWLVIGGLCDYRPSFIGAKIEVVTSVHIFK